jgi:prepilin-type N-terminal cleavage/methylation domain-containing protein
MRQHIRYRVGYTLVELMVALAIVALIVSMTAGAILQYITTGQRKVTEATIRKVYTCLNGQWAAVLDLARNEQMDNVFSPSTMALIRSMTNGDDTFTRVIYVKLRLAQEFPMSMAEINAPPAGVQPKVQYQNLSPGIAGQTYESSAILLAAIRQSRKGFVLSADDLGSSVTTVTLGTSTVQYLVDGWGQPLAFYRWPTGCTDLDSVCPIPSPTTSTIVRDQEDPDGRLLSLTGTVQTKFEGWCHLLHQTVSTSTTNTATGLTPHAYYTVPVVVSSGPDLQMGLTPQYAAGQYGFSTVSGTNGPMAPDGTGHDTDNIYSYRLMAPGARGY